MRNTLSLVIFALLMLGCGKSEQITPAQKQAAIEHSKMASQAYGEATTMAKRNDPAGFLKLYEIATDCSTYTVEYCEVAYDSLSELLYTNNRMWVKTFAKVDQAKFRETFIGVNDAEVIGVNLPTVEFVGEIIKQLERIKGNQQEMELVAYLNSILIPYHEALLKCTKQNNCN
jgi:vacuolar-type H+-ATPase subunit D/Vma8